MISGKLPAVFRKPETDAGERPAIFREPETASGERPATSGGEETARSRPPALSGEPETPFPKRPATFREPQAASSEPARHVLEWHVRGTPPGGLTFKPRATPLKSDAPTLERVCSGSDFPDAVSTGVFTR